MTADTQVRFSDEVSIRIEGHLKIKEWSSWEDMESGDDSKAKILVNKRNAIHNENASIIIARGLANKENGAVYSMHFGSGGATIDPLGNIVYAVPNTEGASASLYTETYFEVVDENKAAPTGNQMSVRHVSGTLFSDVEIRCVLDKNEPFGQAAFDDVATNLNENQYIFDEIGLKSEDGLLMTHVVFSPVEKSANRIIEVVYVLRIRICEA